MVQKLINRYCQLLAWLIVGCLALMVVLVFTNVVLRYAMNSGISISEELSRWLFVWLTFLGAVIAMNEGAHLGTDTLVSRLPVAGKKICLVIGHVLMLYVCWLVFKGTTRVGAGTLAPMTYMQLLGATFMGWLVFGDRPDRTTLLGAAMIVGSGLYLWWKGRIRDVAELP